MASVDVTGLILCFAVVGCGGSGAAGQEGGGSSSGQIAIEGSSTVLPITQAVADEFTQENPNV